MGRTPAVQLAPGVWRISTAPADLVNNLAMTEETARVLGEIDYDVVAFTHEIRMRAREAVHSFQGDKAGVR